MPVEAERLSVVPEINPRLVAQETQTESFQPPVERLRLLGQALVEVAAEAEAEAETASTNGFNPRPVDYRIISQFDQSPTQSFNRQVVADTVVSDCQLPPLKPIYIKRRLTTLARHGYIKRIAADEYASLDHPAPAWQPPKPLTADRISQLVASQPDREWGAAAIMTALNADPNAPDPPLGLHQIQKGLIYLNRRGDRVRAVSRGRYVSVDYDGPVRQQPRKTAQHLFNLFEQNSDQAFDLAAASRLLAGDGHRQVKEATVENNLKLLRRQGLIKRVIDHHHHASLNCPLPEYRPPLSVIDRLRQLLQDNDHDFTKHTASQALATDGYPSAGLGYVRGQLRKMELAGLAVQTKPGHYARPDCAPSVCNPPMTTQIVTVLKGSSDRDWSAQELVEVIQHPDPDPDKTFGVASISGQLVRLTEGGKIKRIGWGRYASVDYDGPSRQGRPQNIGQRLVDIFDQQPAQAFDRTTSTQALASDGHRQVKEATVENNLGLLRRQGLIKRVIDHHHHASLNCPLPEYRPPLSVIDRLRQLLQDNDHDFTKHTASQALATDGYPSAGLGYVRGQLRKMELAGLAVQTKPGHYARPDCAPSVCNPPMTTQIVTVLKGNSDRDWSIYELAEVIQHPDPAKTAGADNINGLLAGLARREKIQRTSRGCYASVDYDGPARISGGRNAVIQPKPKPKPKPEPKLRRPAKTDQVDQPDFYSIPPAPKTPHRVSLGQRIGRATRDLPYSLTPDELIDWVEADGHGPVINRQSAHQLAESVLKRKGKLES